MDKVWSEFPLQKLKQDPKTGEVLMLKNYLALSKNPKRGLNFYLTSNRLLSQSVKAHCLNALYSHAIVRKQRLKAFYMNKLRKFFLTFSAVIRKQIAVKSFTRTKAVRGES